jgi:hypothetical protein
MSRCKSVEMAAFLDADIAANGEVIKPANVKE